MLDTHIWIWSLNRDPRGAKLANTLLGEIRLGISAISIWEAGMLEAKGRVTFEPNLAVRVDEMLARQLCTLVPLLPEIAIASSRLEGFHGDPSDRIIVATGRLLGAVLVTSDRKILKWSAGAGDPRTLAL